MPRRKIKLTKDAVETRCRLPQGKRQVIFWDTEVPGFGLRVGQRTRTYILQRDLPGSRTRRVTIGRHGAWTVQLARKKARELITRIDGGEDPSATRRSKAARGVTLRQALDIHLGRLEAKDASERTKQTLLDEVPRLLGDWMNRPLVEIRRQECQARHRRITERSGPYAASRALRHLRTLWNSAKRVHELAGDAPTIAVDWNRQRRRREPIAWEDLPAWHEKVMRLAPVRRDYNLLVLFTGLRATDAKTIRWEHIDLDAATLHRPKPKGGEDRAFTIPICDRVVEVPRRRRQENEIESGPMGGDHGWVFPTVVRQGRRRVVSHLREPKQHRTYPDDSGELHKALHIPTPHRLRDTFASAAHEAGVNYIDLKLLLNHTLPASGQDVTQGYIRPSGEHLRGAAGRIAGFLAEQIEKKSESP